MRLKDISDYLTGSGSAADDLRRGELFLQESGLSRRDEFLRHIRRVRFIESYGQLAASLAGAYLLYSGLKEDSFIEILGAGAIFLVKEKFYGLRRKVVDDLERIRKESVEKWRKRSDIEGEEWKVGTDYDFSGDW